MTTIPKEQIEYAYSVFIELYNGHLNRQEAIEQISQQGMKPGSALIYLQVFTNLMDGEKFTRTLSSDSFDYFLSKAYSEYGKYQTIISLAALEEHIKYFEGEKNFQMGLVREIYERYITLVSNKIKTELSVDEEESLFPEGKEAFRMHRFKERNRKLIEKAKVVYSQINADLPCQVCGFSFGNVYGEVGLGFIEAHHLIPISELKIETPTRIEDIAFVCSNCHRMLHRKRPWLSLTELSAICKNS